MRETNEERQQRISRKEIEHKEFTGNKSWRLFRFSWVLGVFRLQKNVRPRHGSSSFLSLFKPNTEINKFNYLDFLVAFIANRYRLWLLWSTIASVLGTAKRSWLYTTLAWHTETRWLHPTEVLIALSCLRLSWIVILYAILNFDCGCHCLLLILWIYYYDFICGALLIL